jgi:hypothetical protein
MATATRPKQKQHGGVRGVIESRTSEWDVGLPNQRFVALQVPLWKLLLDRYFRMEMSGWERLP